MKIEVYLSQLLYTHECVVVPEFGGFLTRQFPAQINQATHMFVPPSKRISFNQRLRTNDGVLTSHIAKRNNLSYLEAQQVVAAAVAQWQQTLNNGQQLQLLDIGRFYYNSEGALQFKAIVDVNFSTETFGMGVFRANPILQHNRLVNMNQAASIVSEAPPKPIKIRRRRDWLRSAAVLIPIAGLLFLGIIKTDLNDNFSNNAAAFFNFKTVAPETNNPAPIAIGFDAAQIELENKAVAQTQAVDSPEVEIPEVELLSAIAPELIASAPVSFGVADNAATKPFQVVAGSFSTIYNANKLASSFPEQAFVIEQGGGKLIKVSLGGFDTREEAAAFIAANKAALPNGTWVFKQ